jgi:plastocyanin
MSAMTRFSTLGFLLVALAAGCQSAGEKPPAQQQAKAQVLKVDPDGVQRVTVLAGSYFFKPNHIIVKADTPVEILASREAGLAPHDLVIQAPDGAALVQQDLATEPRKIAFTPRKPGKYPMYCSKKPPLMASHRERGMEGILEVIP